MTLLSSPISVLPTLGCHCLGTRLSPKLDRQPQEGRPRAVMVTAKSPPLDKHRKSEGTPTRAWGVYLVVFEGWVVGGAGGRHLHGGRLRGLDVEMQWPLEEETKAGQGQEPGAQAHTVMSCGVGTPRAAHSLGKLVARVTPPGQQAPAGRASARPSWRAPGAPTVGSGGGRWQSHVVRGA